MKRVLITGGPVHAKLDVVKTISNTFKGGMMAGLADRLSDAGASVTYLCSEGSVQPLNRAQEDLGGNQVEVVYHDGFHDYRAKVIEMAKNFDCVILGAAVVNLIPHESWASIYDTKKFPSHDYKEGDIINVPFTIAPHVISEVKAKMKPGAHLIGFKLLKGVQHEELIRAAYLTLMESHATVVFANDRSDLKQKFAVTKERAEVPVTFDEMTPFILRLMEDEYYWSAEMAWVQEGSGFEDAMNVVKNLIRGYAHGFVEVGDMKFGSVAWRANRGFVTTARGKRETDELAYVVLVNHEVKAVTVLRNNGGRTSKASLNAPLLARIFEMNQDVYGILHFHRQEPGLVTQRWAPPGTVRDTMRDVRYPFNIEGHGCYLFLDKNGNLIKRELGEGAAQCTRT